MTDYSGTCDECGEEADLFSFYEFNLCLRCIVIAINNYGINERHNRQGGQND